MQQFLVPSPTIDWDHPGILALVRRLATGTTDPVEIAGRCFAWVRDEIEHSADHRRNPVTCSASEVLRNRTGFCYAKSHLLAALLRANGIPAGLCYQRLSIDGVGPPYCLHGLNAVLLPTIGWYRLDARGNRGDLVTRFDPPREWLAYQPRLAGERLFAGIWGEPLPVVVGALRAAGSPDELMCNLPDWEQEGVEPAGPGSVE